jgi:site-specific DNA recombinase
MTRTAIYCRVSTPGQKNTTSLPEQERLCREKAVTLGWEVSEPHVYREVEGGEDLYRPCMDRLWDAIARHEVDGVVIDVLDRLSRDEGDVGAVYHHADRYGVTIELASEDRDETDHGRNLRTLSGILARMERAEIRRRTQRAIHARVASGKMLTGAFPLYGYLWGDPDRGARTYYVIDPETAPVVVRIFTRAAEGMSIRQIARELEQEGVPTPFMVLDARGQLPAGRRASPIWWRGAILRILHHPAYWGEHSAYRTENTAVKVRPVETGITRKVKRHSERDLDDPARVALPNVCPPLVSKAVAERVTARLTQNRIDNPGRLADPLATIFRGMTVCGHCGGRMFTAPTSVDDGRRYYCRSRRLSNSSGGAIPTDCPGGVVSMGAVVLDPHGWADVRAWLREPKNVERLFAEWRRREQTGEQSAASRLEATLTHLASLREKMDRLSDAIGETTNREARRALQDKLDDTAEQMQAQEMKRIQLTHEQSDAVTFAQDERDLRAWVCEVASQAEEFTPIEQRAALRALGARVTIWRKDYVHPDGWPQRYKIDLTFSGFTGEAETLPPSGRRASDTHRTLDNPDSHSLMS